MYFLIMLLAISCGGMNNIQTASGYEQKEYFISSEVGHRIKVEIEYKILTKNGFIDGCEISYILTNVGDVDLLSSGLWFENKYISEVEFNSLNQNDMRKVFAYRPEFVFEVKTSDGKVIELVDRYSKDISIGNSTPANRLFTKVSHSQDRHCVSFSPIRIQNKNR